MRVFRFAFGHTDVLANGLRPQTIELMLTHSFKTFTRQAIVSNKVGRTYALGADLTLSSGLGQDPRDVRRTSEECHTSGIICFCLVLKMEAKRKLLREPWKSSLECR